MKSQWSWFLSLVLLALFVSADVDARRLGGGKNIGAQRESIAQKEARPPLSATPSPSAAPSPMQPSPPAANGARHWFGPLAGLAAGLGLAAMFSHLGLGEGFASLALLLFIVVALVFVLRLRSRPQAVHGLAYSGPAPAATGLHTPHGYETQPLPRVALPAAAPVTTRGEEASDVANYPAGFEAEPFLQHARTNFTRMQTAFDRGDMATLRDLCTPEMLEEIGRELGERASLPQQTDVVKLQASIVEVVKEGANAWASVRFSGLIREHPEEPATAFDEVWNLRRDLKAGEGWRLAGIQQLS